MVQVAFCEHLRGNKRAAESLIQPGMRGDFDSRIPGVETQGQGGTNVPPFLLYGLL